jgi:hypothetical protein
MRHVPLSRSFPLPALLVVLAASLCHAPVRAQIRLEPRWSTQLPALDPTRPLEANDVTHGDIDGDGDLDLLFAVNVGGGLWLRNDGDGTFRFAATLPATFSRGAALLDVDGDGDLDAFLAGGGTNYFGPGPCALYRNDGSGNFTPSNTIPTTGVDIASLCHGDLDGDGDQDLVLCASNGQVHVWRNQGGAVFTDVSGTAFPGGLAYTPRGRLLDLDGDGDLDLLRLSTGAPVPPDMNDGAGHFQPHATVTLAALEAGDLDGDGDVDLLTATQVLRNDGAMGFTATGSLPAGVFPWSSGAPGIERIRIVDVDGDGFVDLLGCDAQGRPRLLRGSATLDFVDATAAWFEPHTQVDHTQGGSWAASTAGDFDGDGDVDLVTGGNEGRSGHSTTVGIPPTAYVNRAQTGFVHASRPAFPWLQNTAQAIAAGDVDGDGDLDLVFGYQGYVTAPADTGLWRQDDAGIFVAAPTPPIAASLSAVVLVDVDGDGDLDLFGAAGVGPDLLTLPVAHRLARNDGAGHFTDVSATHLPASAVSVGASCAAGDVDGDGDQDLIVGSYDPNFGAGAPLLLLRNDGTGTFTDASAQLPAVVANARWLALRDLDGDGDLDLLVADGRLAPAPVPTLYFANDGSGTFTDVGAARLPAGAGFGTFVRDLDGDGDLDVAQAGATLWNDGSGTFTATTADAARLLAVDFDRDGTRDDVTETAGTLRVAGQLVPFGEYVLGHTVLAADVDGDGDEDLVVACTLGMGNPNASAAQIGILYNRYRDLEAVSLPRAGQPYRLRARGATPPPGMLVVFATGTVVLPLPVPVPGFEGTLRLDPSAIFLWGLDLVPDADTAVEAALPLAADPSLHGLPVATQAVFVPLDGVTPMALSNALVHTLAW